MPVDIRPLTQDLKYRETRKERMAFERTRRAERHYAVQLRKIAAQIGKLCKTYDPNDPMWVQRVQSTLRRYASDLEPWAKTTAAAMLADVSRRDETAWRKYGALLGEELRSEIRSAPTGNVMRRLMSEQVKLITSLPLDAAKRVHKLTTEAYLRGTRADEVAKEILRSGHVSKSRAMLIARTEIGRTAAALTQARAQFIESPGYVWRTVGDPDVRPLHKKLNGKIFKWDDPPIAGEKGERAHPGAIYNCRCWPEPILPSEFERIAKR